SYPWDLHNRYPQDRSVVNKMQQKYWEAKQAFTKHTGKTEEHVVTSDADLDAKLELNCTLSKEDTLSQEENELEKFLRSQDFQDKTRAGKMMQATGKALRFSSSKEVETSRHRAVSDPGLTVNRMQQCRTEYRGALVWMKDASQELGPDLCKQTEKFRKVFDKLKMDVCQKVDLLGASRCNLLSHMLATYQTTLLHFGEETSHTMAAIHESLRGYQPYEFTTLKSLQDPMRKLVEKEEKKRIAQQESAEADENQHKESSSFKTEDRKSVLSALDKSSTHNACSDELLDTKPEEGSEFSKEWAAVFGDGGLKEPAPTAAPGEPDPRPQAGSGSFLHKPAKASSDLTAWFSLFADLDPLSNPDAVGEPIKNTSRSVHESAASVWEGAHEWLQINTPGAHGCRKGSVCCSNIYVPF
ncbi:hypothetical protein FD755_001647, partial [Muntiacus reevesi]